MSKKHKHYDVIVAWASGAEIEWWSEVENKWIEIVSFQPSWNSSTKFRIKPEPKPDIVLYGMLRCVPSLDKYYLTLNDGGTVLWNSDNVKVIADGETYKIKSVEVIK